MANVFSVTITAVDRATAVAKRVNESIAKITKPISDVRSSVSAFSKETGMDKLGRSIQKVGIFATESARRVASIAPPLAALTGAATIAGVVAFAQSWGRSAVQIRNTAYNIGIGTTKLQEYQGAARLVGLSSDAMTNGLKSVGSAFEDAAAGRDMFVAGVLGDKGIGIHRLKDGSVDTVRALHDVANAASKITNTQARQKFLDIFGLGELSPLVGKGGAAIDAYVAKFRSLNAVMSPSQIAQGERYNESLVALDASFDKLKNSVGSALAPALGKVAEQLIPIANEYGPKLARWIESVDWAGDARQVMKFVDAVGGVKTVAAAVAAITFAGPIAGAVKLVAQIATVASKLSILAGVGVRAAGAAPIAAATSGWGGWEIGKLIRPYYDKYVRKMTGGDRWSLNDYLTGTHRLKLKSTEGYTQDELDSVKSDGGVRLTPDAARRLSGSQDASTPAMSPAIANPARLPLGIRSNNPLNLTRNGQELAFSTPEEGIAAAVGNLRRNYGGLTIAQIQDKWTGGARTGNSPEQIANYTRLMSQATGLGLNSVPDLTDPRVVSKLMGAMIRAENGQVPYSAQQLGAATLAGMQGAAPAPSASQAGTGGAMEIASGGKVHVELEFVNAPESLKAKVRTRGNVSASTNVGHSALLGASV